MAQSLRQMKILLLATLAFSLSGCDIAHNALKPDREAGLEVQDFRDTFAPREPDLEEGGAEDSAGIPALQPYVASGTQDMASMPLVSVTVNQSVPLRDILFELAQQANYDLELDPRITGSIIFTARKRPFDEVVARISEIAGLRYKFENDVLRVELDTPYNKTYKIDYLSYIRSNNSSISSNVNVVSGDGADTGSEFESAAQSEADFWGELTTNLTQMVASANGGAMRTDQDPYVTAVEQNPNVQAVAAPDADGNVQVQPPEAVLRVETIPPAQSGSSRSSGDASQSMQPAAFSVNKQAGLVSIFAPEKTHKEVEKYLNMLKKSVTSQVLIEAKILEVTLNDEFATGINWRSLGFISDRLNVNFLQTGGDALLNTLGTGTLPLATGTDIATTSNFIVGYNGSDVEAIVEAISGFGTVRALASPRLTVLNNQAAVLNVATNRVFFEIDLSTTTEDGVTQVDVDSEIRNVPEGVIVNVQPSIDTDTNTVAMAIRPTITRITSSQSDPAIAFVAASTTPPIEGLESLIPELNVQEIDTVVKVRSGQPVVMGGLLQDRVETTEEGVPLLSEVPGFGSLFKQHLDSVAKTELVILLKATILENPADTVHATDKDFYRKFSSDRRPFKL